MRRIIGPMLVLVLTTCLPARSVAQAPMCSTTLVIRRTEP